MTQKLDIVEVSAYYPPHLGGQENAVRNLATALVAVNRTVRVVTSNLGGKVGVANENGVQVSRLRSVEVAHSAIIWNLLWWLIFRCTKRTVVHLHIGQAYTPEIVWLASKLRGFKYIAHMHIEPRQSGAAGRFLGVYKKYFLRRSLRAAAVVLVLNKEHAEVMRNEYGCTQTIEVVSNGVEEDFFNLKRKKLTRSHKAGLRLLFVGRLSPQKNLLELLTALTKANTETSLTIAGDGELRHEIESTIKEKSLSNVQLLGNVNKSQVLHLYDQHDALILPSLYEAQPLVLLEAMAVRIPIIGTNVMGIAETIQGIGLICEPDANSLAHTIDLFYKQDKATIEEMTRKGYEKASSLRWSNLLKQYITIYDKL